MCILKTKWVYEKDLSCLTRLRMQIAQIWHGNERKTMVYSVEKAFVSFPENDKVS